MPEPYKIIGGKKVFLEKRTKQGSKPKFGEAYKTYLPGKASKREKVDKIMKKNKSPMIAKGNPYMKGK